MKRPKLLIAGVVIVVAFIFVAAAAPLVSPYDPKAISGDSLDPPSFQHWLGTNDIGQDILSQLIWGGRVSLSVGVAAAVLAMTLGVVVGCGAALLGGLAERVVMRMTDIFLALPLLPLLSAVAALAGPNRVVVVLVFGLFGWPMVARLVRSQIITLRPRGYVVSAKGFGGSLGYLARRHLVPAIGPLVATGIAGFAGIVIMVESSLAFIGLADPSGVSWGSILFRALQKRGLFLSDVWTWWVLPAGLTVTLAVLGFVFIALGLDPRFNPRARRA